MEIDQVIREFKIGIEKLYGKRLKQVILYGSWARNQATEDSDIDLAVVLEGKIRPGREIDRMIDIITDLNLKHRVLLSVYPVSQEDYEGLHSPRILTLRREGIPA